MYLAPCWTTTVRGCAVIPVLELTRASLVTQGGNEHIRNDRAQSLSEGKNMAINSILSLLTQHLPRQPIPLEYLRLGSFEGPPEVRKERAENGSFISLSSTKLNMYPFTIYHADASTSRQYTLYTQTSTSRANWQDALVDAIGVRKAIQDANKVLVSPHPSSTSLIKSSGMDLKRLTMVSSARLRARHLPQGRTLLDASFVPLHFVALLTLFPSIRVNGTLSVSEAELLCCRLYQWNIRGHSCRLL